MLKQALLQARGTTLLPTFLPELRARVEPRETDREGSRLDLAALVREKLGSSSGELYAQVHDEVDRVLFSQVLDHTRGNQRDAARLLGISRQTMRVKLRALGLQVTHGIETSDSERPAHSSSS